MVFSETKNFVQRMLPEGYIIAGVVILYYAINVPVWGLGLIAIGILAFKTYRQTLN